MKKALYAAALLATIAAMPALAQTTTAPGTTTGSTTGTTTAPRDDNGSNWGWLGLLGLAGLAPLFMRKDRDTTINR